MAILTREQIASITPENAQHVLFAFGHGGYQGGNFTTKLIDAACVADQENLFKLGKSFPGIVSAIRVMRETVGGPEILTGIAAGHTVHLTTATEGDTQ